LVIAISMYDEFDISAINHRVNKAKQS